MQTKSIVLEKLVCFEFEANINKFGYLKAGSGDDMQTQSIILEKLVCFEFERQKSVNLGI